MDLELSQDQLDLRALAHEMLIARGDLRAARDHLDGIGDPRALIREIAELGWYAVGLDEDDPFGVAGLCLLAERVGYHAAPTLLVDSAVGVRLARGAEDQAAALAASGDQSLALCVLESDADWSAYAGDTQAALDSDGVRRVSGRKIGVHHAAACDHLVVTTMIDGNPGAVLVESGAEGCLVTPAAGLDPSAGSCAVSFDRTPVVAVLTRDQETLRYAFAVGSVGAAAEALGAASRALDLAVEYALERRQYGHPIGSYQALQHLMAELHIRRETSWSTLLYASAALQENLDEAVRSASIAKAYASRAAREIVEGAIQVFGGIGFTWEHDVPLLQRRVLECERRFGDSIDHERILALELDLAR
jgi:alkylation response protein AidB-like acyl-CoA dehydrogenase